MTYRSLSRYSPDFNSANDPAGTPPTRVPQFGHIVLLLLGSIVAGGFIAVLVGVPAYGFTHSMFVAGSIGGISLYATFIVGYHWGSQEREWASLRARFSPVGRSPLILSALSALALIAFMFMVTWALSRAGVELAEVPPPVVLETWAQLPLAFFLIVVLGPFAEELLFRGLLLDWLKQKVNTWAAAVILSLIFSLLHANPFSLGAVGWLAFADRFLLGLGASALTIKYHSLRPAFVMHATFNAIGGFVSVFGQA